ncbi:MAG: hypothetical protein ACFE0O_01780 [Opitutales bacterium]
MRSLPSVLVLALLLGLPAWARAQTPEDDPAVSDPAPAKSDANALKIVRNYLHARGGKEAILAVKDRVFRGDYRMGRERKKIYGFAQAPHSARIELHEFIGGKTEEYWEGTNGKIAWRYEATKPRAVPERMPKALEREFIQRSAFYNPLVEPARYGLILQYRGTDKFRGRGVYLVKAYFRDGRRVFYYFDQETFHLIRYGSRELVGGLPEDVDIVVLSMTRLGGALFPRNVQYIVQDQVFGEIKLKDFEGNVGLDEDLFEMPESGETWIRSDNRR